MNVKLFLCWPFLDILVALLGGGHMHVPKFLTRQNVLYILAYMWLPIRKTLLRAGNVPALLM